MSMTGGLEQLALLALEAVLVAALLLFLYELRTRVGLTPLFVAVGTFQYLQTMLALSVYVEVYPGIVISPGSSVLFTSTLFVVLVVYLQEDVSRTRGLIYGLLAANVTLSLLSPLFGRHLDSPVARNLLGLPRELFAIDAWVLAFGSAVLMVDVFLLVLAFEAAGRIFKRGNFLRIFCSMSLVLIVDSVLFVTGTFFGQPEYRAILLSSIVGKLMAAFLFTATMTLYLRVLVQRRRGVTREVEPQRQSVFQILSFRQRYERMRELVSRDALTGLFNRGFFDEVLPLELARSDRSGLPTSLILADLDHFKAINDRFGHPEGDRVLRLFARSLKDSLRTADVACRYGGEEFAVILPHAAGPAARQLADRIRERLAHLVETTKPPVGVDRVTVTVGVATFPKEATTPQELVALADRRLYEGKAAGRDRVVGGH